MIILAFLLGVMVGALIIQWDTFRLNLKTRELNRVTREINAEVRAQLDKGL